MTRRLKMTDVPEYARNPGWPEMDRTRGVPGGEVPARFCVLWSKERWVIEFLRPVLSGYGDERHVAVLSTDMRDIPMLTDGSFETKGLPPEFDRRSWEEARWAFRAEDLVAYRDRGTPYCPTGGACYEVRDTREKDFPAERNLGRREMGRRHG